MNPAPTDRLYALLPAAHRVRDHAEGQPLRALLRLVEEELDRIDDDVAALYENWFIETCQEWVVPYIGDLLRVRPIHAVDAAGVTMRAYVANTIAYRRRKGTAVVLEQLARDTTGWPARAVEFYARLATTQHMNHVRRMPAFAPGIRDAAAAELTGSAFDRFSHTLEVRRIASGRGRYNIPNVGLFLWRLQSYPIGRPDERGAPTDMGSARPVVDVDSGRLHYTFHPLGLDAPLFIDPQVEETITHLAEEVNVPAPLRRLALHEDLDAIRRAAGPPSGEPSPLRFMGADPAFRIFVEWTPGEVREVPPGQVFVCDIPDDVERASPAVDAVAVDPERGRLALADGAAARSVRVTYSYGFAGDLGGGPYDRAGSIDEAFTNPHWQRGVSHVEAAVPGEIVGSLRDAIDEWHLQPSGTIGVIALMDSLADEDADAPLLIRVPARSRLLIVGADWPGPAPRPAGLFEPSEVRPHHLGDLVVYGEPGVGERGTLAINGLLLEGSLRVADGDLGALELSHSTIDPRVGRFVVEEGNDDLRASITRCIVGILQLESAISRLTLRDCLVVQEATASPDVLIAAPKSDVEIDQTTVLGGTQVRVLEASNSIFDLPVVAQRRQQGCVRFSYVPAGSRTPRRHRCQPDTAIDAAGKGADQAAIRRRVVPAFESRRYGDPDFGQLDLRTAEEIRHGADDGSEMGAYSFLKQPQREANLRGALDEYLRLGLEAGLFFVRLPRRKGRP